MDFVKKNKIFILIAILVGLISVFPSLYFEYKLGGNYHGVAKIINDDDIYYLARGESILNGHYSLGNPYIEAFNDRPTIQFFIPDLLAVLPAIIFGIKLTKLFTFYDFLMPAIIALLIFIFSRVLSIKREVALPVILSGVCLILFEINRPVSPQFTLPLFILSLLAALFLFRDQNNNKPYIIFGALSLGALFYFYTYYWTYIFSLYLLLIIYGLSFKRRELSLASIKVLFGALLLAIPYFYHSFSIARLDSYSETLSRLGMINSHFPSGFKILAMSLVSIAFSLIIARTKKIELGKESIFFIIANICSVIVVNQHVITGKNLEFSSHYFLPAFISSLFLIALTIDKFEFGLKSKVTFFFLSGLVFSFGLNQFFNISLPIRDLDLKNQRMADVYDYINNNILKDSVIFSDEDNSSLIPSYTKATVFYTRNANLHFMTDKEIIERFLISHYFDNVDEDFIKAHEKELFGVRYIDERGHLGSINKVRSLFGMSLLKEPEYSDLIDYTLARNKKIHEENFVTLMKENKVSYLLIDKEQFTKFEGKDFETLGSFGDLVFYGVR